jgi:hypothetical protein
VLRGVLSTTVLVVLYYLLPLDKPWNGDTAVSVLIGLLVFAGVTAWQVRTIAGSRYPGVKAFEALGLIVPFESHPEDCESGHAEDCSQFAAELAAWQAERDACGRSE